LGHHHSPRIVTTGLVLALDAANQKSYSGTGSNWTDLSGTGNTGTLVGAPTFDNNNSGSLVFNGSEKRATLLAPFGQIGFTTASVWYKRTEDSSSTSWRTLLSTASTDIHHLISQNTTRNLGIWDGSFKDFGYNPPIDEKFHNYLVIYQNGTSASLYVDGKIISTVSTILDLSASPIGTIGNWSGGTYWAGHISNVQVYSRALTQLEITQNYNAIKGRYNL
jgi:hypothetical protein